MLAIFFLSIVSVFFGIILTLCIQYYIVYVCLKKSPVASSYFPKNFLDYSLPQAIKKQLENENLTDTNKGGLAISLVLQFLFHELRHSEGIRRWLYKKLSLEFDELLTKTTLGKFFDSITIKDMHLGNQFPDIKDISINNAKLDKHEEHLETVSLCVNIDYTGNFMLSVDARMKFGKTAYLSIKVERIRGLARLQFSRQPYTHWSFSFFSEPTIDLAVESHFQGRQLQSNITNLIMNQIKKAIKRKHTLPNYKLRYKPFFAKTDPSQLESEESDVLPYGQLEVNIAEVSRLALPENAQAVYCTIAIDSIPWISLCQKDDGVTCMTLEITMTKSKQAQLGVIFRQDYGCVSVDSVASNSSAYKAGLRAGDIVISVENRLVNTVPQVGKFIKSISGSIVTLRIERVVDNYVIKAKNIDNIDSIPSNSKFADEDDTDLAQMKQESFVMVENTKKDEQKSENKPNTSPKMIPSNENMAKLVQNISSFTLRKRKVSGSVPSTPNRTPKFQHAPLKKSSVADLPEIVRTDLDGTESERILGYIEVFRGKDLPPESLLPFDDVIRFFPRDGAKYINVNAWAIVPDGPVVLLGYMNVPLAHVANECSASVLGYCSRRYSFLPPGLVSAASAHPLRAHSGFEHVFCFGDALLCFSWIPTEGSAMKRKVAAVAEEKNEISSVSINRHDFVRTQFHGTTHCDYCSKKIWLKDAVQCRQCAMSCHKKCVAKCQLNNPCATSIDGDVMLQMRSEVSLSDVILTADVDEGEILEANIKRVNSVSNLTIPGIPGVQGSSKSLPPSPNRSPARKQSLVPINPFVLCPTAMEDVYKFPKDAHEIVSKLLDQVMQCPVDDSLMDNAKESGQKIYVNLGKDEKVDKITVMMAELKKHLDLTTFQHAELSQRAATEECEVEKTKMAFLLGQTEAKIHALSALMLHYCSGLQYTQEKII